MNGYRTFIAALASAIGGIATVAGYGIPEDMLNGLTSSLTAIVGGLMFVYGVAMYVLRAVTDKPLFDGKSHAEVFLELLKMIPALLGKKGDGSGQGGFVRLLILPWLIAFALALSPLAGCGTLGLGPMEPIAVPENLSDVGKEAQKIINEANVVLIAAYDVVREKRRDRLITRAEAFKYLNSLDDYSEKVDEAQKALALGNDLEAKGKAEIIKTLINVLHKEVAAKARQS